MVLFRRTHPFSSVSYSSTLPVFPQKVLQLLKMIQETLAELLQIQVQVTYFQADEYKSGGRYLTIVGYVKKIESYERVMVMTNGLKIPMEDIYKIESSLLPG